MEGPAATDLVRRSAGSFRDPSGFVFERAGAVLRQVNRSYREQYDQLLESGLYRRLTDDGLLIPHVEGDDEPLDARSAYKVLRPDVVPFVSYPYEWSFSQLQDAALLTLMVQRRALESGMSLKDASAYNVQFLGARPVFIDTLSFEPYREGEPWVAYRQFCRHFLAPLALMALRDVRLGQFCRANIDGIPLDLASRLLPWTSRLKLGLALHLHLHARFQSREGEGRTGTRQAAFGRTALLGLIDGLESAVRRLRWDPPATTWSDYYAEDAYTYSSASATHKGEIVAGFLDRVEPASVWDLGANTGVFSRLAGNRGIPTVSFDFDPSCVERNYREARARGDATVLPLVMDLLNPSPAAGWRNAERMSLLERGPADLVMALALIHHIAIAGEVPLERAAEFFHQAGRWLAIEFVPPDDPQARRLLDARRGIHHAYDVDHFQQCFQAYFDITASEPVAGTGRVLFLMRRRPDAVVP